MLLIERGASANTRDINGDSPLIAAARSGDEQLVGKLLPKVTDVNGTNIHKMTALHEAARYGHTKVIGLLIGNGADVYARNCNQDTPIEFAVNGGHYDATTCLLDKGKSSPTRLLSGGRSLLDLATMTKQNSIAVYIVAKRESMIAELHNAARVGDMGKVRELMIVYHLEDYVRGGRTAKLIATDKGHKKLADNIIIYGAFIRFWRQVLKGDMTAVKTILEEYPSLLVFEVNDKKKPAEYVWEYGGEVVGRSVAIGMVSSGAAITPVISRNIEALVTGANARMQLVGGEWRRNIYSTMPDARQATVVSSVVSYLTESMDSLRGSDGYLSSVRSGQLQQWLVGVHKVSDSIYQHHVCQKKPEDSYDKQLVAIEKQYALRSLMVEMQERVGSAKNREPIPHELFFQELVSVLPVGHPVAPKLLHSRIATQSAGPSVAAR